ncbi:protein turtle homolog B, partial [Aplysia californica]|uniref:Protein turtle homolog B n=1 Tax=Aplysia californica TaxID=6500 RepID=A0ABM1W1M6_APLCA
MPCHGVGTPAVTTAWSKVWGRFDPSTDDRITLTDTHLEIRALTKDDHGKYECKATNTIATVVTVTELRIENTTPHAPYNVTVLPGHFNVTIRWEPAYDGGTPQHYLLWFRESSPIPMSWVTMSIPSSATRSFKLFSLQPATEYEFKILSRNQLGNGSFSDVVIQSTLGYDRAVVTALPVNRQGQPYYPDVTINHGPQPSAPLNLSARVKDGDILLAWIVPLSSPVPIFSYRIEYSLNGGTVIEHAPLIQGGDTRETSMTGMPSGTYDIRLRSYGVMAYSRVSNIVRVVIAEDGGGSSPSGKAGASSSSSDGPILPEALVGGIVGGVLFLLVSVLLALVAIFHSRRKGRCTKDKKYNDVNYGKPDEVNGRQHEPAAKRDRWQQNGGGGDLVTSLNNTDSIFFLPQTRTLDQSSDMRASLLSSQAWDQGRGGGRRVDGGGGGYFFDDDDRDLGGRQVPLTNNETTTTTADFVTLTDGSSRPGSSGVVRLRAPGHGRRHGNSDSNDDGEDDYVDDNNARNLTWPERYYGPHGQPAAAAATMLSRSLPLDRMYYDPHGRFLDHDPRRSLYGEQPPAFYSPTSPPHPGPRGGHHQLPHHQHPQHHHPPLLKSRSFPSHPSTDNDDEDDDRNPHDFPRLADQYPSRSAHPLLPPSHHHPFSSSP